MRNLLTGPSAAAAWLRGAALLAVAGVALGSAAARADGSAPEAATSSAAFELDRFYGLGITQHHLDGATDVVGWRISESWYLGQRDQQGAEDGLSLVWQGERKQASVSIDEIRFVRRF